jgi:hypothetical protein
LQPGNSGPRPEDPPGGRLQRGDRAARGYVSADGARRDYSVATKVELVEILYFKHFYEHFTFGETDWSKRGKRLEKYVRVAIAIELVTVGTKLEDL